MKQCKDCLKDIENQDRYTGRRCVDCYKRYNAVRTSLYHFHECCIYGICKICGKHSDVYHNLCMDCYKPYHKGITKNFDVEHVERNKLRHTKTHKGSCKVLYDTKKLLEDDKEALIHDNKFIDNYVGFNCKRLKKKEEVK